MDSSADCFDQTSVKHEAAVPHHPALGKVVPHARYEQVFSQLLLVDAFPDKILQTAPIVNNVQRISPVDVLHPIPPVDILQLIHGLSLVEPCINMYITGKYRMLLEDFLYSAMVYIFDTSSWD